MVRVEIGDVVICWERALILFSNKVLYLIFFMLQLKLEFIKKNIVFVLDLL